MKIWRESDDVMAKSAELMKKMYSIKIRKKTGENETETGKLEGIVKSWSLQQNLET